MLHTHSGSLFFPHVRSDHVHPVLTHQSKAVSHLLGFVAAATSLSSVRLPFRGCAVHAQTRRAHRRPLWDSKKEKRIPSSGDNRAWRPFMAHSLCPSATSGRPSHKVLLRAASSAPSLQRPSTTQTTQTNARTKHTVLCSKTYVKKKKNDKKRNVVSTGAQGASTTGLLSHGHFK